MRIFGSFFFACRYVLKSQFLLTFASIITVFYAVYLIVINIMRIGVTFHVPTPGILNFDFD